MIADHAFVPSVPPWMCDRCGEGKSAHPNPLPKRLREMARLRRASNPPVADMLDAAADRLDPKGSTESE